jgi:Bacterial Ig-like domain
MRSGSQRYSCCSLSLTDVNGCNDPDRNGGGRGLTPSTVLSVARSGASDPWTIVTATFIEAMNPSTINVSTFTLTDPNSTPVSGSVTYNTAKNTATFAPSSALRVPRASSPDMASPRQHRCSVRQRGRTEFRASEEADWTEPRSQPGRPAENAQPFTGYRIGEQSAR